MERFHVIAFTHHQYSIEELGELQIDVEKQEKVLKALKKESKVDELMLLSTCNRVEFCFCTSSANIGSFYNALQKQVYRGVSSVLKEKIATTKSTHSGTEAIEHFFRVASSLDSLVIGEREIITQVRTAFENCRGWGFTGDYIRLVIKKTIECAKEVYTKSNIAKKPVSVVSLAYRKLREQNVSLDSKVSFLGAGATNSNMAKYLKKHGFSNFTVFNRSEENAQRLAAQLGANSYLLSDVVKGSWGASVLVTCTGSTEPILTSPVFDALRGTQSRVIIVDLGVPSDTEEEVKRLPEVTYISIESLKQEAEKNLKEREGDLSLCEEMIGSNIAHFKSLVKSRKVELAMKQVPQKVKEIKQVALNEVFASDLNSLDAHSKEVLDKVVDYLEKKYISVPMKLAKEIMLEEQTK